MKKILVIIKSNDFNCELILPEKNAGRLARNILNYYLDKAKYYIFVDYLSSGIKVRRHEISKDFPVHVEFREV